MIGSLHLLAAVLALTSGLLVLLTQKGKRRHRRLGWTYVGSMAVVNVTALMIYELFGGFGPFHAAALVSGVTVAIGAAHAMRRRPARGWIEYHAHWMVWSYIGLVAAAVSEISTRFLDLPFGATVMTATALVVVAGGALVFARLPRALKPFVPRSGAPPNRLNA